MGDGRTLPLVVSFIGIPTTRPNRPFPSSSQPRTYALFAQPHDVPQAPQRVDHPSRRASPPNEYARDIIFADVQAPPLLLPLRSGSGCMVRTDKQSPRRRLPGNIISPCEWGQAALTHTIQRSSRPYQIRDAGPNSSRPKTCIRSLPLSFVAGVMRPATIADCRCALAPRVRVPWAASCDDRVGLAL
jgi:hypothetical protein